MMTQTPPVCPVPGVWKMSTPGQIVPPPASALTMSAGSEVRRVSVKTRMWSASSLAHRSTVKNLEEVKPCTLRVRRRRDEGAGSRFMFFLPPGAGGGQRRPAWRPALVPVAQ